MHAWFFLSFPAPLHVWNAGPEKAKNLAGQKVLRLIQIRLAPPSLKKSRLPVKPIFLAATTKDLRNQIHRELVYRPL
jgi:hypothetical protein